jgi:ADP-heptose:LPS heptosyltransferase
VLICPFPGFSRASLHPLQRYRLLLHYARLVRRERYTMAIIARPDHWWGALLAALAGIPTRIGYDVPETQPFLTLSVPRTRAEYPAGAGTSPSASAPLEPGLLETTAPSTNRLSAWRRRSPIAHPDVGLPQPAAAGLVPTIHDPQAGARPEALTTPHTAANALALAAVAAHSLGRDLSETASYPLPADAGPEERAAVDRLLAEAGVSDAPFVVLQPGAGSPLKAWHAERLAAVGAALANDLGARIVVSGSAAEHALAQQVCDALPSGAINLAGALKWTELEALLARAQVVVGVDSGPLHVAVAASTPSVALFGPADPAQFGPWGDAARHQVVTADLPCRPCRRLDWCALEPAGVGPPPCMRAITVEAVIQSARAALAEGKHGSETTD